MNRTQRRKQKTAAQRRGKTAKRLIQRADAAGRGTLRSAQLAADALLLMLGPDRFKTLAETIERSRGPDALANDCRQQHLPPR